MSKRLFLASAFAFVGAAVPASANWTGLYIGAHAGGIWGDVDTTNVVDGYAFWPVSPGETVTTSPDGVLGGAQLGYNFAHSGWLFGIELTGSGMDLDETIAPFPDDVYSVETEWLVTAAGRLGWIWNQSSLIYVKGGYAAADIQTSELDTVGATGSFATDETHHGWMAGAGFERMISSDVSVGVEYNYIDLGTQDHSVVPTNNVAGTSAIVNDIDAQLHTVTARLNWHFWP